MPVKPLAPHPDLDHLKHQAKDLLKAHAANDVQAAQRIREFHPRHHNSTDGVILTAALRLSDAQLVIAREHGFANWAALKGQAERPEPAANSSLPYYQRIGDPIFLLALRLLDAGEARPLRELLRAHPALVRKRLVFPGQNYFRNPTLLEFVAENPVRNGTLPANIVEVAKVILDAGADQDRQAMNDALGLVCSGCVSRETGQQLPLIDLLCASGADPTQALSSALCHGEFQAAERLIQHGARVDLPCAAALGRDEDARSLLAGASSDDRHRALALASQFGRAEIVRLLLEAGEDPNRFNPPGTHSHSTPLHQAASAGHLEVVRMLVKSGARLDLRDVIWQRTPADWAAHGQKPEAEAYLRAEEERFKTSS